MTKTYICDACGRISTITWDNARCHFCGSATHISREDATEIPVPKDEFGTDFIAVVHRGNVVDVLLLSDRSSVHGCGIEGSVQAYVDRVQIANELQKATDIEVKYENNSYLVRVTDGVAHIMIPMGIAGNPEDVYLSASEREAILTVALISASSKGVIEVGSAEERGGEAQCLSTRTIGDAARRCWRAAHGTGAKGAVRAASAGVRNALKQSMGVAKRMFEVVLVRKTPSLLTEREIKARETAAALTTEHDKQAVQAEDGLSFAPNTSVQAEKPRLIPEIPKRNVNFSQHPYHRIALALGYTYLSQVSSKIDYFVYAHPVGHNLEFAKLPAESGNCHWTHISREPFLREEGSEKASLITYLLARHGLKIITDSPTDTNLSPPVVLLK